MVKQVRSEERLVYCSGPNWEGDGSKASAACPFGESLETSAALYKCSRCTGRRSPAPLAASILQGLDDMKAGKVQDATEAFAELDAELASVPDKQSVKPKSNKPNKPNKPKPKVKVKKRNKRF